MGIMLNTVNEYGGQIGSIPKKQVAWMEQQIKDNKDKYIILFSHHNSKSMFNVSTGTSGKKDILMNAKQFIRVV